ncbi:uncharacterized protein LOC116182764 [Photinus pyralis]|uniref:Tyr recombinase domain-containing protein n=3 Tax=Photinus pyralis TaxID=7054 RepID=A0A1Y1NP89_PHOPY|nr:uncharacterized protein LOC116169698 [Photinus pyralis]XP_031343799.1 uncharacterized protein LOC116171216 [Photinus pyralis]XP_031345399.1 uncharacterized protein LOC116172339 [Photinus pyralis]XP_031345448.1 uncharacterized protein LOC116172380 [Photinus pyralis]XP_031351973.1 uncharacterized protein LOC116177210 [Photinus pyralis]XP_031359166.1 uncharacterized protein LOC116182764 [Photinus pyralis]
MYLFDVKINTLIEFTYSSNFRVYDLEDPMEFEENFSEDVLSEIAQAEECLVPIKSKKAYKKEFDRFCTWRREKNVTGASEKALLAYFSERSKICKPSCLWTYYSMVRAMLRLHEKIDISKYGILISFLKAKNVGYKPKKSQVLSREQVIEFLQRAPDEKYLFVKVVTVLGIAGCCRTCELVNLMVGDVEDRGTVFVVNLVDTKTHKDRYFTVIDETAVDCLGILRAYIKLRPPNVPHNRFFLNYRNERCTTQPVGKNSFSKLPCEIAKFLKLSNPSGYTGHCYRRTSATSLIEGGGDLCSLQMHGDWKSSKVAQSYVDQSMPRKMDVQKRIFSTVTEKASTSVTTDIGCMVTGSSQHLSSVFANCTFNHCKFDMGGNCNDLNASVDVTKCDNIEN